jgi:hypothetical protein
MASHRDEMFVVTQRRLPDGRIHCGESRKWDAEDELANDIRNVERKYVRGIITFLQRGTEIVELLDDYKATAGIV